MSRLGSSSRRLFPDISPAALAHPDADEYIVIRLLAEGDGNDLRSLLSCRSEDSVRRIFLRRSRQLDRRSRVFWSLVLSASPRSASAVTEELWPL